MDTTPVTIPKVAKEAQELFAAPVEKQIKVAQVEQTFLGATLGFFTTVIDTKGRMWRKKGDSPWEQTILPTDPDL